MLLTIHDANLAQVGWIDNDKEDTLNFFNDTWTRYLETGASTFEFSVFKKAVQSDLPFAKSYMALNDRAFVSFVYKGEAFVFSLMELEEDEHTIRCVGENLNMELINEHANAYKATQAMTFKQYCEAMDLLSFSFLQIGVNEVSDKKLTLEWEGRETKLARLLSLAGRFSAEIDFQTFLNRDGTIKRFVVNVYRENDGESQGVGRVRADLVLEYGDEVQTITRHIDKRDVVNAIRPVGKDGLTIDGMSEWKQYTSEGVLEFYQGGSMLYAPLSMQMYPSAFTSTTTNDNWIRRDIDVDTEDKTVLRAAGIKELRKYAYPATTYKVKGFIDADIGDTLTIKDPGFEPLLLLTARVSEQKISFTNPDNNETEFSNFAALANRLSDGIQAALERAIEATKRYTIKPATSAGVIFKNGLGESIMTGTLYKGATPIAQDVTWVWFVNGTYRTTGPNFTVRGSEVSDKLRVTMVAHVKGIEVAREDVDFVNVLDGAAGTVGPKGADGRTTILHIAYANSADGSVSFSVDNPEGREYMGQYTDFEVMDSTDYRRYTWSKIKGDKGDQGPQGLNGLQGPKGDQGLPGAKGADGKTSYTHVAYANSADGRSAFSTSDSNRTYIGVYVDQVATDSADPARYKWTLVKGADGAQGIPGAKGADGRTPYLHIAYATNSTGTAGFSTTDSAGRTYIGQYTDYAAADSTNPASYKWTLIKGDKGDKGDQGPQGLNGLQGVPGPKGTDGQTLYTWVKYADSPVSGMSDTPTGKTYMGIAYNKTTATESTTYSDYTWSLIKGDQGVQGPDGINGRTLYTWVKYADDDKGAGMSDSPTGKRYLGLAYNKTTASKSLNAAEYSWSPLFDNVQVGTDNLLLQSSNIRNYHVQNIAGGVASQVFSYDETDNSVVITATGQTTNRWWGASWDLSINKIMKGEKFAIRLPIYRDTSVPAELLALVIKNHTLDKAIFAYNLTKSKADAWEIHELVFEAPLDMDLDGYGFFVYVERNGKMKVGRPTLVRGNIVPREWLPSLQEQQAEINSKADAGNTIQRLNELAEAQRIAEAELEAKATASELAAWVQAYRDFVSATGAQQKDAERKFAEISANVNKIVTDYGNSVTRWQYVNGYMDVADQGLKLGRDDDGTSILIQNNGISMISAGKEVMSISEGVIRIDNGVFTKTLRIGRFREEQYEADQDMNVIRYVGP